MAPTFITFALSSLAILSSFVSVDARQKRAELVKRAPVVQNVGGYWKYNGCLQDNVNQVRTLPWQLILKNNNTAHGCLDQCQKFGYPYGGMEYGEECYCGDDWDIKVSGAQVKPEINCQVPCSGNNAYICGGGNFITSYRWIGPPLAKFTYASGAKAGKFEFLIGGLVVPLITVAGVNGKVTFIEKYGTSAAGNSTGSYELDISQVSKGINAAWRQMTGMKTDVFCSAGLTLPDKVGRQITIGGWSGESTYGTRLYWPDGSPGVASKNEWQENVQELSLQKGRWYPSAMIMSNGSILVVGGEVGSNAAPEPSLEILPKPVGGYAKYLDFMARTDPNNLYPFLYVLPNSGGIFIAYYNEARILDPGTFSTRKQLPNMPGAVNNFLAGRTYPMEGTAVMWPLKAPYTDLATIMMCGGSTTGASVAVDNCVSTQPDATNPTWTIERMNSKRVMTCMVGLPDGTFLIMNGAQQGVAGFGLASNPNHQAILYNPYATVHNRMTILSSSTISRLYHSEAILLQDGRVLVSGSDPEDNKNPQEYRVETFTPPYLLQGFLRPSYSKLSSNNWLYGTKHTIVVAMPQSKTTGTLKISLVGAVSSTHGNSMGQRTIFPAFSCQSSTCTITAPPNNRIAPPGWFMLFILDGPTPSTAQWVRIGGDPAGLGNWPKYADFKVPGV